MNCNYPNFKTIEVSDKYVFDAFNKRSPGYCDFNFMTLYIWSSPIKESKFCILNDNLIIKRKDYNKNKYCLSFLGQTRVLETTAKLLSDHKTLNFVPSWNYTGINPIPFKMKYDRDNFDYILPTQKLATLKGTEYKSKRRYVKKFLTLHPHYQIKLLDLTDKNTKNQIIGLTEHWYDLKGVKGDSRGELYAIQRLLTTAYLYNTINIGIYINKKLTAFTINEIIKPGFAIGEVGKADTTISGLFTFLEHMTAKILENSGIKYLNYEEDMGIEGLRQSKLSWRPYKFLYKYKIANPD